MGDGAGGLGSLHCFLMISLIWKIACALTITCSLHNHEAVDIEFCNAKVKNHLNYDVMRDTLSFLKLDCWLPLNWQKE